MTPEKEAVIAKVREYLTENLVATIRQQEEETRAAYDYFFCTAPAPRISLDDKPLDFRDDLASSAYLDPGSYDAAKVLAIELLEAGEPLPERLAKFTADVMRGLERPNPNKGKRRDTGVRNEKLAWAIWRLESAGIPPTKSAESEKKSGCDIVAAIYDDLLANDAEGVFLKPRGGEFSAATMREIWLKDPEIQDWKGWMSCLPDEVIEW